jgi:DNA polymerase elongation subunit (family B)
MPKFYNIDPETCSENELLNAIEECRLKEEYYHTMEQSCKVFINSQYGALANSFYNCSNINIAESITLQGQDLIKYSVNVVNAYFNDMWNNDIDAHRNIAQYMKEQFPTFDVDTFMENAKHKVFINGTLQIYGDTDSAYITLQPLIDSCQIPLEMETRFVIAVNKFVLDGYLDSMFNKYAQMFNCKENLEKFELEKVARSVIMLAKKKYIMDISWKEGGKDGVYLDPLHVTVIKGIEVIQGATPGFCRKVMKDFINFILEKVDMNEKISYDTIVKKLKDIKQQFILQSPNEICKSFGMSDYEKYIRDDKKSLELFTGVTCPIHVRGAAKYNYMLYNSAKKYKTKYNFIKKGDKVKFYYVDGSNGADVFSFLPNEFPMEFAPKMDYDLQFDKLILDPLNRIIQAVGFQPVPNSLTYSVGLW